MKTQQQLTEYLKFSKKDRVAILIIASVMLTAFLLPSFLNRAVPALQADGDTAWISALKQLEEPASKTDLHNRVEQRSDGKYRHDRTADRYNNGRQAELFNFDPNTLDDAGWKRLGIREKTASTIRKYLEKGGKFRRAEDLHKIYALRPDEVERLIPYTRISSMGTGASPSPGHSQAHMSPQKTEARDAFRTPRNIRPVDINTADSLAFESLPGIGPTLASRIIRFRDKLGGFYDVKQISETFGISDSTFVIIKSHLRISENYSVQKIDINSIDLNGLRKHPYMKYNIAAAIINYRTQHGLFTTAEQLKQLPVIDDVLFEKLVPYLSFTKQTL